MALLTFDWSDPLADAADAPKRDLGSLWVFGVVIDAQTTRSQRFLRRVPAPGARSFETTVEPIGGLATAGLIALWSRWRGGCGHWVFHGDVAATALDALVAQRLPAANLRDLQLGVEQDIADTVRRGWTGLGPLADDHLAIAHRLVTLDGPVAEPIDLRLSRYGGDRMLHATLRYGRTPTVGLHTPRAAVATPSAVAVR
jgi:hypothetical protein